MQIYKAAQIKFVNDMGPFRIHFNYPGYCIPGNSDHGYGPLATVVESFLDPGMAHRQAVHATFAPALFLAPRLFNSLVFMEIAVFMIPWTQATSWTCSSTFFLFLTAESWKKKQVHSTNFLAKMMHFRKTCCIFASSWPVLKEKLSSNSRVAILLELPILNL